MFRFIITLFSTVMLLVGCASSGPINSPNFDSNFINIVDSKEKILLFDATQLRAGTYMEGEIKMVPSYWGVMLLTDRSIRFLSWNSEAAEYRVGLEIPLKQLLQTKFKFNTLISSFVAVKTKDGQSYAFMLDDPIIKNTYHILLHSINHPNQFNN